jgi:hypothetical protein
MTKQAKTSERTEAHLFKLPQVRQASSLFCLLHLGQLELTLYRPASISHYGYAESLITNSRFTRATVKLQASSKAGSKQKSSKLTKLASSKLNPAPGFLPGRFPLSPSPLSPLFLSLPALSVSLSLSFSYVPLSP